MVFVWCGSSLFCGPQQRKNAQLCFWIQRWTCAHEVDRVEKGKESTKQEQRSWIFGGSEWASGWPYGRDVAVVAPTKAKAREDKEIKGKKGNQKGDPKERKEAAEARWPMGSGPIAWSLDIGVVTAPICLSTWPRRIQEDKNLFLQANLLLLRNPQQ